MTTNHDSERYSVYILASHAGALYIGITIDLMRRIAEHRAGTASAHTRRYRIHRLVHVETADDVHAAIAREKQLKGWRREKKLALIRESNPAWDDLAEPWLGPLRPSAKAGPWLRSG
jgi:putative endonuclease